MEKVHTQLNYLRNTDPLNMYERRNEVDYDSTTPQIIITIILSVNCLIRGSLLFLLFT